MRTKHEHTFRVTLATLLLALTGGAAMAQISNNPGLYTVRETNIPYVNDCIFTDAQYYNGKLYAAYIDGQDASNVRVGTFDVNGVTGEMKQRSEYLLRVGGIYQDAELVVFRNRLYLIWKNNTSGQIWIGEIEEGSDNLKKTRMLDDGKTYANFGATIYRDKICVILHRRTSNQLQVYHYDDPELNDGWTWCGTVRNGDQDNIKLDGSQSLLFDYTPDDHWDVESWYGFDKDTGKPAEKLIVGRIHNGNFEAFSYQGEYGSGGNWPQKWNEWVSCPIGRSKTFSLKLAQGAIEGYTDTNEKGYTTESNPMIFSYCTYDGKGTGEHFLKEFYPGENRFSTSDPIYTDLPYGYVSIATAAFPTSELAPGGGLYYKQFIYLNRGNKLSFHWGQRTYTASIRSNELVEKRQSFDNDSILFANPELRKLVRLVGIVEGPPPTVVDNNDWFRDLGVASSLDFSMGSSSSSSVSRLYKSEIKCSFGPHTDKLTAAFGGGYAFQKEHEEVQSQSESITVNFVADDTTDFRAIALYSVPILTRCDLTYLTPTGRNDVRMPVFSYTYMPRQSIKQVELPLYLEPFCVDKAYRLSDWEARDILVSTGSESIPSKSVNFTLNTPQINMELETSGTISDSQTHGAISLMDLKFPFFQLENQSTWEWTDKTTTSTSKGFSATYSRVRRNDPHVRPGETAESFSSTLYLLTPDKSRTLLDQYYPKLLERKIAYRNDTVPFMLPDDKPFVLAWDINNITYTHGDITTTSDKVAATEPLTVTYREGTLTVDCLPGATVNVYRMDGVRVGSQQAVSGRAVFHLSGDLYTVEVITQRYRKIQKVAR